MNDVQRFDNLKQIVEKDPDNFQARRELIVLCLDFGFEEMALKHLNYLVQVFPNDANLHFNMGICFEKLKKPKLAQHAYERAVKIKDDDPDYLYNLALICEELGEVELAMNYFKKVAVLENDDENAFFCIGCLYIKKNDTKNAAK